MGTTLDRIEHKAWGDGFAAGLEQGIGLGRISERTRLVSWLQRTALEPVIMASVSEPSLREADAVLEQAADPPAIEF